MTEKTEPDFEESLAELEQIVRQLDGGKITLDESLEKYETGIRLLRRCHLLLDGANRRIEILRGVDENGSPILQSVEEDAVKTKVELRQ